MRYFLVLATLWLCHLNGFGQSTRHKFSLGDSTFLLDGKPFLMISGEMHYARVPREAWRQRMRMAKAMGLNTIGTYVFWNLHEPEKGVFDFKGNNDIAEFVRIAQEEGLWVILRPSPYVCAEWEYGGYPYWLQNEQGMVVRSTDSAYLQAYRAYIREVGKQLAPHLVGHGGNILMIQVENEYGSYGQDSNYLRTNESIFRQAGFDGLLYTCDPPQDLPKGHLSGLLPAVNGLTNPVRIRALVRKYHGGKGPFYVSEWYPAWFDWWGEPHHTVPAEKYMGQLDTLLAGGISINMYMFHGGTTRGFMNGANADGTANFEPEISSYDYDAPLDEAGNATAKFMAFRSVISRHLPYALPEVPPAKATVHIDQIHFDAASFLFDWLGKPIYNDRTLTFEQLHQAYGFVLYRTVLRAQAASILCIHGLRDFAIVFVNGKRVGVLDRRLSQDSLSLAALGDSAHLDILVENLGRVNFGPNLLRNTKGITGDVELNGTPLRGWEMYSLPFDRAPGMAAGASDRTAVSNRGAVSDPTAVSGSMSAAAEGAAVAAAGIPVLKKGHFILNEVGDTYLDMSHWGKGIVWVNGHNLGRYWRVGPQQTLYVPVEWLKKGSNEVDVLELLTPEQDQLSSRDTPILNQLGQP
jgi:beta-galactosidase